MPNFNDRALLPHETRGDVRRYSDASLANVPSSNRSERGSSLPELIIQVAIVLVLAVISFPSATTMTGSFKLSGDARNLAGELAAAKLRGASDFTRARLNVNSTAKSFQIELWDKTSNAYVVEGGTQYLAAGNSFSFGSITAPAGSQTSIQQTYQIIFNSRSIPVDGTGSPTGSYGLYLTNGLGLYYAVTLATSGEIQTWRYSGSSWVRT